MNELNTLLTTAFFIGTVHTFIGVDHYLPFVVLSKSNHWSIKKTLSIVFVCGLGHVLSSVLLGFIGLGISSSLSTLVGIEVYEEHSLLTSLLYLDLDIRFMLCETYIIIDLINT